jgi:hypothetical protein
MSISIVQCLWLSSPTYLSYDDLVLDIVRLEIFVSVIALILLNIPGNICRLERTCLVH